MFCRTMNPFIYITFVALCFLISCQWGIAAMIISIIISRRDTIMSCFREVLEDLGEEMERDLCE